MKTIYSGRAAAVLALAALAASAALAVRNRTLRASLARAEAEISRLEAAAAASRKSPGGAPPPRPVARAAEPAGSVDGAAARDPGPPAPPPAFDSEEFEKAVETRAAARAEEIVRERHDEREARRREWENATEEEREARRKEFQQRMQEHATAQISDFESKAGLDDAQCAAFEMELESFDARVREISERFAVMIDGGMAPDFEMQVRMMNEMSEAALDAYDGLDEVLPEGWRKSGGSFNMLFGMSPTSLEPVFDAMRRTGGPAARGPGPFGPFMGGPRPRRRP